MKIPLHELLLDLRRDLVAGARGAVVGAAGIHAVVAAPGRRPLGYRLSTALARLGQPLAGLLGPGRRVVAGADAAAVRPPLPGPAMSLVDDFVANAEAVGCRVHRGAAPELDGAGVSHGAVRPRRHRARSCWRRRRTSRGRTRSCPDVHVTLLREDRILPGLDELFAALGDDLPSALAIVTGPSRSADIEQKLAVGVHGPRRGARRAAVRRIGSVTWRFRSTARARSSASGSTTATTRRSRGSTCRRRRCCSRSGTTR